MNLEADRIGLSKIVLAISHKIKLIQAYNEAWLEYEKLELDEADNMYRQKCKLELELISLEKDKKKLEERIKSHARKKARST